MSSWSPYNYTFNNPIRFIDPDGSVPGIPPELIATAGIRLKAWANDKLGASLNLLSGSSGSINAPAGMVPARTQQMSRALGTISDATSVAQGIVDVGNAVVDAAGSIPVTETASDLVGTGVSILQGDTEGIATYGMGLLIPGVSGSKVKAVLKGASNPKVKAALKRGKQAHSKFSEKAAAKGWDVEPRLTDPKTGKTVIPDAVTPSGHPIELKPNTPSGRAKGSQQIKKYERATNSNGRVIYYDPEKQ